MMPVIGMMVSFAKDNPNLINELQVTSIMKKNNQAIGSLAMRFKNLL